MTDRGEEQTYIVHASTLISHQQRRWVSTSPCGGYLAREFGKVFGHSFHDLSDTVRKNIQKHPCEDFLTEKQIPSVFKWTIVKSQITSSNTNIYLILLCSSLYCLLPYFVAALVYSWHELWFYMMHCIYSVLPVSVLFYWVNCTRTFKCRITF